MRYDTTDLHVFFFLRNLRPIRNYKMYCAENTLCELLFNEIKYSMRLKRIASQLKEKKKSQYTRVGSIDRC